MSSKLETNAGRGEFRVCGGGNFEDLEKNKTFGKMRVWEIIKFVSLEGYDYKLQPGSWVHQHSQMETNVFPNIHCLYFIKLGSLNRPSTTIISSISNVRLNN